MTTAVESIDYITQSKTNPNVKKLELFLADESLKAETKSPYSNISDQGLGRIFKIPFKHSAYSNDTGYAQNYDELMQMTTIYNAYKVRSTKTKMDTFFELLEACRISGAVMNFSEKQYFTIQGTQEVRNYDDIDNATSKPNSKRGPPPIIKDDDEDPLDEYESVELNDDEPDEENPFAEIDELSSDDEESPKITATRNGEGLIELGIGAVTAGKNIKTQPTLAEEEDKFDKEYSHSGIMFDFDIFQEGKERQFRETQYYHFVYEFGGMLAEILEWDEAATTNDGLVDVWSAFIVKPEILPVTHPKYGACYKDGFHIVIPGIQVTKNVKRYIIHMINERGILNDTFRGCNFLNPIGSLLDPNSRSVPVLFLGNAKRGKQPYLFHKLYLVQIRVHNKMPIVRICDDFDPLPNIGVTKKVQDPKDRRKKIEIKQNLRYKHNLCHELSLCYEPPNPLIKKTKYDCKESLRPVIDAFAERRKGDILQESELRETASRVTELSVRNSEAAYLQQILNIISPERVREYDAWKAVIIALARRNPEYKPLAAWFSQRFPSSYANNAIGVIESLFDWVAKNTATDENDPTARRVRSIATLYDWAKHDNPEKYKEIQNHNAFMVLQTMIMKNDGNLNDANLAKVLWTMFRNKFVFALNPHATTKGKQGEWYEFVLPTDNLGRNTGGVYKYRKELYPYTLDTYINEKLPEFIALVREWVQEKRDQEDADEAWQTYYTNVYNKLKITSQSLGNSGKSTAIITKCENEFLDRGFVEQLDTNKHVIGVGNGVLRLFPVTELIQQFHDIPISRYTDVEYIPYDIKNPYIAETEQAIRDLFANEDGPETDAFEFTMMYLSSTLDGRPKVPLLYIWLGEGSNGKSFLLELHINTLRLVPANGYGAKLPVEFLTVNRPGANSSNPAMMMLKSARFVYFSESEKNACILMGNVKEITSETLSSRNHHESQDNFRANCHFVFASNNDPRVKGNDWGTWRRIIVYRFKMKFVPSPDPTNWQERKQDAKWIDFAPNSIQYRRAYLSILVHYYEMYRDKYNSNLHAVPKPTIERETAAFRNEQDTMHRFIDEKVIYVGPGTEDAPTEKIALETVAKAYIKWFQREVDDVKISEVEIKKELQTTKLKRWIYEMYKELKLSDHILLAPNEFWDRKNKKVVTHGKNKEVTGTQNPEDVDWTNGKDDKKSKSPKKDSPKKSPKVEEVEIVDDLDEPLESTVPEEMIDDLDIEVQDNIVEEMVDDLE